MKFEKEKEKEKGAGKLEVELVVAASHRRNDNVLSH